LKNSALHRREVYLIVVIFVNVFQNVNVSLNRTPKTGNNLNYENCVNESSGKGTVPRHSVTRLSEKPFKCEVCSKILYKKCNLVRHNMIHTGEKPFLCDICGRRYLEKSVLVAH
jgi:uncharacterized Zn-finger protein